MYVGILWHIIAKIVFVFGSYLLHFYLGKNLTVEEYGIIGTIITIINFNYLFFSNGARQTVSKTIAQNVYDFQDIIKKGCVIQTVIVLIVFIANFKGAAAIASLLGDKKLIQYIKYAAWMIPFTGIYFLCLGILNGFKLFVSEAIIAIAYPLLKLSVIIFVESGFFSPIEGTITGFLIAVIIIAIISLHQVYINKKLYIKKDRSVSYKNFLKTTLSYSVLFSVISLIMNSGTLILKSISQNNTLVGYYTGCTTFGQVPYFLLTAIYLVILPVITKNYNDNNLYKARQIMKEIFLMVLIMLLPIATIIAGFSSQILSSFYNNDYFIAANSMSILIVGTFCLGMTIIFNMIISSTNRKKFTTLLSVIILFAQLILCYFLTKNFSINGTSLSLTIVSIIAMSASYLYLAKLFGRVLERTHFLIILFNIFLFILIKLFSGYIMTNNLLVIILLCTIIYFAQLITLLLLLKIKLTDFLQIVLKK